MDKDRVEGIAQQGKGAMKETAGKIMGDEKLKAEGKTILLVEQNARKALQVADYAYVMERGRIALSGTGQELLNMPEVQRTYLGQTAA